MARAIDADKLKKELAPYEENDFSQQIDVILKIVDMQPTLTPPNEWVSVEDRLPENYTDVLCWYEYFRYGDYNRMYQTYGIGYCINGQWGGEVSNGTKCKVLYWQPLPAPPDRRTTEGEI